MNDLFPKFIIEGDNLIISKVKFHKDIATDPTKVKGGGWYRMPQGTNKIVFYGRSEDFGPAQLEDIRKCVEAGRVFSNKLLIRPLVDRHTFAYDTGTEEINLGVNEYIICAANHYDDGKKHVHQPKNITSGFVVCGRRHHNCINIFALIVGFPYDDRGNEIHKTEVQGFLTNSNRFVDRQEAYKIAFAADQIIGPNKGCPENSIGLTSEDLY